MNHIFWEGYCNKERIAAIDEIQGKIGQFGFIIDSKRFSDISISIIIEIEELHIDELFNLLKGMMSLRNFEYVNSKATTERLIFFNITFIKGTGDLIIEVPALSD